MVLFFTAGKVPSHRLLELSKIALFVTKAMPNTRQSQSLKSHEKYMKALTWGASVWFCALKVSRRWLWTQGWWATSVIWKMRQLTLWPLKTPSGSTTPGLHYSLWTQKLHLTSSQFPRQLLQILPSWIPPHSGLTPLCAYMQACIWFIHSDSVIHLGTNRGIMKSSKNSNWIDL